MKTAHYYRRSHLFIIVLTCHLLIITQIEGKTFMDARPSQPGSNRQILVGVLCLQEPPSKSNSMILDRLNTQHQFQAETLILKNIKSWSTLKQYDVIWTNIAHRKNLEQWDTYDDQLDHLSSYFRNDGKLLLTNFAAYLPHKIGIESKPPEAKTTEIKNRGHGRQYGFQSFRGHPILKSFFGGGYIWEPEEDTHETRIGYFEDNWPAEGKVVGIEKSYITLHQDNKLVIEYESNGGRLLSIGGFIHFDKPHLLQLHMERFVKDVLNYLAAEPEDTQPTYWLNEDTKPRQFSVSSSPLKPGKGRSLRAREQTELLLTRELATDNFFDVSGRRCLIMGKETGEIDEVWVHPFRVLRDFQIGIVDGDSVTWLKDLPARVEIRPESVTQIYQTRWGEFTQIVFADQDQPGGIVHLTPDAPQAITLALKFRCDLRWMWPYRPNTLGSIYYGYDDALNTFHIKDRSGDFYCLLGGDLKPATQLQGQFEDIQYKAGKLKGMETTENQVYQALLYELQPDNHRSLNFAITGTDQGRDEAETTYRNLLQHSLNSYNQAVIHYRKLLATRTIISSPDPVFNEGYRWALVGTDRFFVNTPELGNALLAGLGTTARGWDGGHRINGRPGYAWYFGRDAEWSGLALNHYGAFEQVKEQLAFFAKYQDLSGKIFHEITTSGVVHFDAADATPLYLILAAHYLKCSGDLEFIKTLWPSLQKAMQFMYSTDTDGDRLIENTNVGHGWIEGGKLYGAHTTLYLAGCWAQALKSAAYIAHQLKKQEMGDKYQNEAQEVVEIIHTDFWNEERQFFNYGKWKDGSFEDSKTVLPTVLMSFNLLEDSKVQQMLREYGGTAFNADWGTRILSTESPYFNPKGYHYGSVWPLFTGWTALAQYQYGDAVQGFTHIMNNLLIYKNWALGFVEEVMHGMVYKPGGVCAHQCWSETNILHPALSGMLGLEPDALNNQLTLKPKFPLDWDHANVNNIHVGETRLDLKFKRDKDRTTYHFTLLDGPDITINLQPEIPEGMKITSITMDGQTQQPSQRGQRGFLEKPIISVLQKETEIQISHQGGIGMVPFVPQPKPGEGSEGYRIVDTALDGKHYRVILEGKAGSNSTFLVKTFGSKISSISGATLGKQLHNGMVELKVEFEDREEKYIEKTVTLTLAN